jgi:hypothetical protein
MASPVLPVLQEKAEILFFIEIPIFSKLVQMVVVVVVVVICSVEYQTQGHAHARQALPVSYNSSPGLRFSRKAGGVR